MADLCAGSIAAGLLHFYPRSNPLSGGWLLKPTLVAQTDAEEVRNKPD
jgi:hypothetical protein